MKLPYIISAVCGVLILALAVHLLRPEPEVEPFAFTVSGNSMLPTLEPGDLAYAERIPWDELEPGMIVTTTGGVVHWTVERNHLGWVLKGGNNPDADRWTMTRKDYEATVLYWQDAEGNVMTPEYAERFLK